MPKPVRPELIRADFELRRFMREQRRDAERLGYPKCSAFAKDIARGTISPAHITEDVILEAVGRWFWSLNEIRRRVVAERYESLDARTTIARRLSMSVRRLEVEVERLLLHLTGFLDARAI